jgi:AcrR family transcriptional regulator
MPDVESARARNRSRGRRSHAERTAETRAKIVAAAVASVAEVGFARTTAAQITRRAGVTWGAVQHHFGDKDGMWVAVLENSFERFASRLDDAALEEAGLEKRASLFVDRAWEHFASPLYRSTYEILLDQAGREGPPDEPTWQERMFRAWDRIWMRIFGDAPVSRGRHFVLQHYTIAALSGLASVLTLEGAEARLRGAELDLLKETLARELSRGGAATPRRP